LREAEIYVHRGSVFFVVVVAGVVARAMSSRRSPAFPSVAPLESAAAAAAAAVRSNRLVKIFCAQERIEVQQLKTARVGKASLFFFPDSLF
jgi:hypothetical protein